MTNDVPYVEGRLYRDNGWTYETYHYDGRFIGGTIEEAVMSMHEDFGDKKIIVSIDASELFPTPEPVSEDVTKRYRAVISVTETSRSGFDTYEDTFLEYVDADDLVTCKKLANELVDQYKKREHRGDFNICLQSFEAEIVHYEEYSVVEKG